METALRTSRNDNPFFISDNGEIYLGADHASFNNYSRDFPQYIWRMKYRYGNEQIIDDTLRRVAEGVYAKDTPAERENAQQWAFWAMQAGLFLPGGRILASAGTLKHTTSINCYVSCTIEDSMVGIMKALTEAALTQQMGGGIGMDFSTLRPKKAKLKRTGEGSSASGALPFMDMWHAMCQTIMSAGSRRGAMMGTLSDTHPDLPDFIAAKTVAGRLTNFNVSILVSDAFMAAIQDNEDWPLYFSVEPTERAEKLSELDFVDDEGVKQYVYEVWKARELWNYITETTYKYSEPGVIFIDRVNELNNLNAIENIRCTNPCGEQPLPPYACCNLGALNLGRMVLNPFKDDAKFNYTLLAKVAAIGVRFLDNVVDTALYPLEEQAKEEHDKRRIGLGITGLADAMNQLGIRYGSYQAAEFADKVMRCLAENAYEASIELAQEKGPFALYRPDKFLTPGSYVAERMPANIIQGIKQYGIRNGVLLTVAPVGTGSLFLGDTSSGLEPVFAHKGIRKILQPDNTWQTLETKSFSAALLYHCTGQHEPLDHMVTAEDLQVHEHILIQAKIQHWVDASVSKTINCPESMTLDEFRLVYDMAYKNGLKGCTTYRPSEVRGSILAKVEDARKDADPAVKVPTVGELKIRPDELDGKTYKIKWPHKPAAMYMTINHDEDGRPFEIFITSKDASHQEWITALTLMITAIFRKGGDIGFVAQELKQIQSFHDTAWIKGKYYGSIPSYIGHILEAHLAAYQGLHTERSGVVDQSGSKNSSAEPTTSVPSPQDFCPQCASPTLVRAEGCKKCTSCGYSTCG